MATLSFEGSNQVIGGEHGLPGLLMPVLSMGNPLGSSTLSLEALKARLVRCIVPRDGQLLDLVVFNRSEAKGNLRAAVFDTGQAAAETYTLLGQGATVKQGESFHYQSLGNLGSPALTAGQHIMLALVADTSGTEVTGTFPGPASPLPTGYLPGAVLPSLDFTAALGSIVFPGTLAASEPSGVGAHMLARVG
jgi:hypothetical protein